MAAEDLAALTEIVLGKPAQGLVPQIPEGEIGTWASEPLTTSFASQVAAGAIRAFHITDLEAGKLLAGTIKALVNIGTGNILLDGSASLITIKDNQ